jgi:hypothetical protein
MNAWCRSDSREPLSPWKRSPEDFPVFNHADISGLVTSATSVTVVSMRVRVGMGDHGHGVRAQRLAGGPRDDPGIWRYRGGIVGMHGGTDRAAPANAKEGVQR